MTRTRSLALCCLAVMASCTTGPSATPPLAHIDHIIVGVADLDAGIAELERVTGVRASYGGEHPGRGTRNALMSLGDDTYLELLAPDPAQQPADKDELRELQALARPTPIGWAVSGRNEPELRAALAAKGFRLSPAAPGSRRKPDGSILRWLTFGYEDFDDPLAPFFIFWADPALHPSRTSAGGCSLTEIVIHHSRADPLREAIAPLRLDVVTAAGPRARMRVRLRCGNGDVVLG